MSNEKIAIYRSIRADLLPAEASIDDTLGGLGSLLASTCDGLGRAGVTFATSGTAINQLLAAAAAMGEVRQRLVRAHAELAAIGRIHLPELNWGDGTECPKQGTLPDELEIAPTTPLRVAA